MPKTVHTDTILDAASEVFLRNGYSDANMDEIAAVAGVSKVTIYKRFPDKHTLFTAVFTHAIEQAERISQSLVDNLSEGVDIGADLRTFARQHIILVTDPALMRMRQVIISEAHRFPELAQAWHRAGPERGHTALAAQISKLVKRGLLQAADPLLAAQHLNYLILSIPVNEAMFNIHDGGRPYSRRRLQRFADEAVRVFMAAYGTHQNSRNV